jgi:glutathionylspermidine synthase
MNRFEISPRSNWVEKVESLGLTYHTAEVPYWFESAYYGFSLQEIEQIEQATAELWELCLHAVQYTIDHDLWHLFKIPASWGPIIRKSWDQNQPSIYGRFDLAFSQDQPKLLEFNADTPTSLFEASIVQWCWLQDMDSTKDQFNSLHEKLVAHWKSLSGDCRDSTLHFSLVKDNLEDLVNVEYLRECATEAGLTTALLYIDDIGWDKRDLAFVDLDNQPIRRVFKLYPWEWLIREAFAPHLLLDNQDTCWIEPAWKMILSNKAILALLWQLFPNHPNLLPAFFDQAGMSRYVKKPLLSREGANISIVWDGEDLQSSSGEYGAEGFVYQQYFPLPSFQNNHPVIGSWIIGGEPAGIGIRESCGLITDNYSRFVPHLISS